MKRSFRILYMKLRSFRCIHLEIRFVLICSVIWNHKCQSMLHNNRFLWKVLSELLLTLLLTDNLHVRKKLSQRKLYWNNLFHRHTLFRFTSSLYKLLYSSFGYLRREMIQLNGRFISISIQFFFCYIPECFPVDL